MSNRKSDNTAYMNFIETLNDILTESEIKALNYS